MLQERLCLIWMATPKWKVVWVRCAWQRLAGLDRQGCTGCQVAARPPLPTDSEPGGWVHGWQHCAASVSECCFITHQAQLRSHSGSGCSHVLHGCPSRPQFKIETDLFLFLITEAPRPPLQESAGKHARLSDAMHSERCERAAEVLASGFPLFLGAQLDHSEVCP